jgi:serine/threonine-protein kinase
MVAFGRYTFDSANGLLRRDGVEVPLPPRVLGVLAYLLARPGQVVARQELIDAVWKDAFVTDTSLAEAVSSLRQALGDDPQEPIFIQTLHRRGYRFVAPLSAPALSALAPIAPGALAPIAPGAPAPSAPSAPVYPVHPSIAWQLAPWSAVAILTAVLVVAIWKLEYADRPAELPVARFAVDLPASIQLDRTAPSLALSPDGSRIVWTACVERRCGAWLRAIDTLEATLLAGTAGASAPFFSPDGRWLGFFADGQLKKLALAGGAPTPLAEAPEPFGASWGPDGRIVFAGWATGGLWMVDENGGAPERLTTPDPSKGEVGHRWPFHAGGSRSLVFTIARSLQPALASAALIDTRVTGTRGLRPDAGGARPDAGGPVVEPGGSWRTLLEAAAGARVAAPGLLVFARGAELVGVAWDDRLQALAGAPVSLVSDAGEFAVSAGGTLVYAPRRTAVDRDAALPLLHDPVPYRDSRRVAGVVADARRMDVWIVDTGRGGATRLTHDGASESPVWSADGLLVAYASRAPGPFNLFIRSADGSGEPRRLGTSSRHRWPASFTPDGRALLYTEIAPDTQADIWLMPLETASMPRPVLTTRFAESAAAISPDGRWMAYQSNDSGRWEVYLQPWSPPGRRRSVSTSGGTSPRWSENGRRLFYTGPAGLTSVSIEGTEPAIGAPAPAGAPAVTPPAPSRLIVTLQWTREARRRVPPGVTRMTR